MRSEVGRLSLKWDPKTAPTEPTTPHVPIGKPRDRVGSSGCLHPEEAVSLRRPRVEQGGGTRTVTTVISFVQDRSTVV